MDRGTDRARLWAKLDEMPERPGRILKFMAATGCRPGEACGLKWSQVYRAIRKCAIPRHKTSKKTGEPRVIALNDEALDVLDSAPASDSEYVFPSRFRKPYTIGGCRRTRCTAWV